MLRGSALPPAAQRLARRERPQSASPSLKFSFLVFLILFNWCQKGEKLLFEQLFLGIFFSLRQHGMSRVSPKSHPVTREAQSAGRRQTRLPGGDFLPVGVWERAGCESEGLKTCF